MAYIGNTNTTQTFVQGTDYFNGDGSTVAFTLSRPVVSVNDIGVFVNNVAQQPSSAYTVSGSTLTFTGAPSSGTNNIYVRYLTTTQLTNVPAAGSVGTAQLSASGTKSSSTFLRGDNTFAAPVTTPAGVSDQSNTSTGAFQVPAGTAAQRPGTAYNGYLRYNSDSGALEGYLSSSWVTVAYGVYSVDYLAVAGGGGGGDNSSGHAGGGGGAGGYLATTASVTPGTTYTVTIGGGGAGGGTYGSGQGQNGSNSTITGIAITATAVGGGGGGGVTNGVQGSSGGSGGGGAGRLNTAGGSGTPGQGYAGGYSDPDNNPGENAGGGGGGAGQVGGNGSYVSGGLARGGAGGNGLNWQSLGTYYAGGGGGGVADYNASTYTNGTGGSGGGGTGGKGNMVGMTAGSANTGGGGGGTGASGTGANGGSGIVIIRYAGGQRAVGGTITQASGYTYHTFTSSGTITF